MSVTNKHSLYGVEFNTTLLGAIVAQRIYLGTEVRAEPVSGEVFARNIAIVQRRPGASFSTLAIAAGMTQLPAAGISVAGLAAGIKFYAQKHLEGGTRTTGATHRKYTGVKGIAVPKNINCDFMGDAKLDAEYFATYDGTNDPIVEADTVSLPSGITDAERFTLGKVTVGGILLDHLKGISIDFGIAVELEAADNDIFPRFASIMSYKPVVTFRGINVEWMKAANIPRAGVGGRGFFNTYTGRKLRRMGHTLPLVWSGASRTRSRIRDVRATRNGVRIVINAPTLNFRKGKLGQGKTMREEMTTVSAAEREKLAQVYDTDLTRGISDIKEVRRWEAAF